MNRRGIIAATVLIGWGAGLALLFARELNPTAAARIAEVALRVVPITTYYMVERDGQHVGFASIEIDTVPRTLQVTEYLVIDGEAVGVPGTRVTDQTVARLSRGLALREFDFIRGTGADTTATHGEVTDSSLVVTRRGAASGLESDTVPIQLPAFPGAIAPTVALLLDEPRIGYETSLQGIDPVRGLPVRRNLRLAAESLFVVVDSAVADSSGRWFAVHRDTVRAWRVVSEGDGPPLDSWLDAQGLIVEALRPDGLRLRRTAFELAFENWRRANPARAVSARADGRIVAATWLAGGAPRPAAFIDTLRIRLGSDVPRDAASWFGGRARPGSTRLFARSPDGELRSRYRFPTTDRWQLAFRDALGRTPMLEIDNPAIAQRAVVLRGSEPDPLIVARRIVAWVHDSLTASVPATPRTAGGALVARGGDAREFALVATALARAAGIPARLVSGLLYHDGRFFTHAWSEVYIGRWLPVDAMLGQVPADAAHLGFVRDVVDVGPELVRALGRLRLEVIGVSAAPVTPVGK
ncbi:MAG TPA: transglutaminase-like domain-containing protein [Gemmatimonadaceae bacterium]